MSITEIAKEVREACIDVGVDALMSHAECIGYKAEEPEECVRWELAKAFYEEYKKEFGI